MDISGIVDNHQWMGNLDFKITVVLLVSEKCYHELLLRQWPTDMGRLFLESRDTMNKLNLKSYQD